MVVVDGMYDSFVREKDKGCGCRTKDEYSDDG
jgi:hypothetical protein